MSNKVNYTTIPVRPDVRDSVRSLKHDEETYSELLTKMAAVYDPAEGTPRQATTDEAQQGL